MHMSIPRALTIAGSDSGGGAGIQADLKTFTALNVYGLSVITSLTAQNTVEVTSVHDLPTDFIGAQFDAVLSDIGCDASKIGMLSNRNIIKCVVLKIKEYNLQNVVLDPVMVSKGGSRLLREDAVSTLIDELIPLSRVVTPNSQEAEVLSGLPVKNLDEMMRAAEKIIKFGCGNVIIKGGHLQDEDSSVDVLYNGKEFLEFRERWVNTKNTHGTGCTYSSAICAGLAKGKELSEAVKEAKTYTTHAIRNSLNLGSGHGPLKHY